MNNPTVNDAIVEYAEKHGYTAIIDTNDELFGWTLEEIKEDGFPLIGSNCLEDWNFGYVKKCKISEACDACDLDCEPEDGYCEIVTLEKPEAVK